MEPSTLPLSSVCSCWRSQLIPSALRDLQRGIEREKDRLIGKPFVVVMTCQVLDYDGLTGELALLEGFTDKATAIQYAQTRATATLAQALAEPPPWGDHGWRLVEDSALPRSYRRRPTATIASVFTRRLEVATGTGYDCKQFEFDVLHVAAAEIVGPELFCFLDAEGDWTSYLIERGRT